MIERRTLLIQIPPIAHSFDSGGGSSSLSPATAPTGSSAESVFISPAKSRRLTLPFIILKDIDQDVVLALKLAF